MARTSQPVQIGKRKIELSNLNKVLYPDDNIIKAEIIEYYLTIAPTILSHIKNRALSLIRFPDGIYGEQFFQKNRPKWAPDWVEYVTLGTEKKDYMLATEEATLVWLANLACLEMHQIQSYKPHFDKPDYFVFDLDPPENYPFKKVVEIGFELKGHIESFGYNVFAKTTGGKGIHLVLPIDPKWNYDEVFEAAQLIAKPFVSKFSETTTLHLKKDARKGRVLIDIFRNRNGQTIVCPYSLRGRKGAPVSMPLTWEQLAGTTNPNVYNLKSVLQQVKKEGDAWETMAAFAVELHTKRKIVAVKKELNPSRKRKTPEQLKTYSKNRDFEKTPVPGPAPIRAGQGPPRPLFFRFSLIRRCSSRHLHSLFRQSSWNLRRSVSSSDSR